MTTTEFEKYLNQIQEPRRTKIKKMFEDLWERFFSTPASSKYHGVFEKGLYEHTILVTKLAINLYDMCQPKDTNYQEVLFCALVHDIGKIGTSTDPFYISKATGYEHNKEMMKIDHELLTLFWLNQYGIEMTEREIAAIYYHAGPYVEAYKKTAETGLLIILCIADNLAAKIYKI